MDDEGERQKQRTPTSGNKGDALLAPPSARNSVARLKRKDVSAGQELTADRKINNVANLEILVARHRAYRTIIQNWALTIASTLSGLSLVATGVYVLLTGHVTGSFDTGADLRLITFGIALLGAPSLTSKLRTAVGSTRGKALIEAARSAISANSDMPDTTTTTTSEDE